MFNQIIKTKQPFATDFLEAALAPGSEKLANSYLLTGSNVMDMYFLALETARILNCGTKSENCTCNNCNWTRQNRHPAVTTISPIDYIHANDKGLAKTKITVDQARHLKQELLVSSQYHRVVIFTHANETKDNEAKAEQAWTDYKNHINPPVLQNSDSDRANWIPLPLDYKIFHSAPANTLLKTIEEPPPGVTFFFLAKDREEMLDTIVSRSQIIPMTYSAPLINDFSMLENFFKRFPPSNREEAILFSERLMEVAKENSISLNEMLNIISEYFMLQIRENSDNKDFCARWTQQLKNIQLAQAQLKNYVNPQAVMDSFMIGSV